MATFEVFRLLLLLHHDAKLIGDEEFILLYDVSLEKSQFSIPQVRSL